MHIHVICKQTNMAFDCYDESFWLLLSPVNLSGMLINMYVMLFCVVTYMTGRFSSRDLFQFQWVGVTLFGRMLVML